MFSITHNHKNGFSLLTLRDETNKTSVEVIPDCGGILHSFNVWHNDAFINVIDGYDDLPDFKNNVTAKGFKSCKLSPFACRIKDAAYTFEGTRYNTYKFILNGSALHGLLYDASFSIVSEHAGENSATVVLQHHYKGTEKGYPFLYDCTITYQLKANNELVLSTGIINRHDGNIPVQDGWHPYFRLGKKIDELQLTLHTQQQVVFDEKVLPTGELKPYSEFSEGKKIGATFFDDCFSMAFSGAQPVCILTDMENRIQVEISPETSYPYVQLYTPPHRNSIAIENLSAPPDTFNTGDGLVILAAGERADFTTTYAVRIY